MKPIPGARMFKALQGQDCIVMACNARIDAGLIRGIFKAAKEDEAALILELARTECNLAGGYTGFTPDSFSRACQKAAEEAGVDIWALHADHIAVKKGTPEEIKEIKELILAQIKAGYTSFAIDASHLFNFQGKDVQEELAPNIKATIEIANFIKQEYPSDDFGLEVEVGEIGRKDGSGMVITTQKEAVTFISALAKADIHPHVLAIANGSAHGMAYDEQGRPRDQVEIDVNRTKEIAQALEKAGFAVKLAQHGTTGIPLDFIKEKFPHQAILKGNVGTFWMNTVWDVLKKEKPELYQEIWSWTLEKFKPEAPDKKDSEIFGRNSKFAIKDFKKKIDNLDTSIQKIIENRTYQGAKKYFDAFKAHGSAQVVGDSL